MKITCYQFKSFKNQILQLEEALQVVVGNNGSGKSTLCEALSIVVNASNPHHTRWEEKNSFEFLEKVKEKEWALRFQLSEILFQTIFDGNSRSPKWSINEKFCSKPTYEDKMPYRAFWIQSDHLRVIT